jgi:hypothetical protein
MDEIEAITLPNDGAISEATFYGLIDNVRRYETIYKPGGRRAWLRAGERVRDSHVRRRRRTP